MKVTRIVMASFIAALFLVAAPCRSFADEVKLEVQGPSAVKLNLEKLIGKKVTLRVTAGEELSGTLQSVGIDAVVLSQLAGREYFDALVPLNQIVAVIVRNQ